MKHLVVGLGYVGLANLAFLSSNSKDEVVGYDKDEKRINDLKHDDYYLEEAKLNETLYNEKRRIVYTSSINAFKDVGAFYIAVGTPSKEDGAVDMACFYEVIKDIKEHANHDAYVVIRSTVEIGTGDKVNALLNKDGKYHFNVISLPEFLSESSAYEDEMNPARFVIGVDDEDALTFIKRIRKKSLNDGVPFYSMSHVSAEMSKYASNAFLATKISFINEMSRLAESLGGDIVDISNGMGADPRIGHSMLNAGVGFGGSCFPKDTKALIYKGKENDIEMAINEATLMVNITQPLLFLKKIEKHLSGVKDKKIAILGLAYKEGTGDNRSSPSLYLAESLLKDGAILSAYDPSKTSRESFKKGFSSINVCPSLDEAVKGVDAVVFLSSSKEFKEIGETRLLKLMKGRYVFDGRNIFSTEHFKYCSYISIGRKDSLR